jgi:hypothetical protein
MSTSSAEPERYSLIGALYEPETVKGTHQTSEHGSKSCTVDFDGPETIPEVGDAYIEVTVHLELVVTPSD